MGGRLLFYIKHAFRSLQRERRRSLFAVFAVAVGVAAIVSLQSLGPVYRRFRHRDRSSSPGN